MKKKKTRFKTHKFLINLFTNMLQKFIKVIFSYIGITSNTETNNLIKVFKNASYLTIGSILSEFISFIGFIFIARLLGPSDYGIYTTVGAFVAMFGIISLSISKVILREGAKDLKKLSDILNKTVGIKIFTSSIAVLICILGSFLMPYSAQTKIYIFIYSFFLVYTSFTGFFGAIYQAAEKMQFNAAINIINRILFVSFAIFILYMGYGLTSLFIISLLSNIITLLINYKLTRKFVRFKFWNKIKIDKKIIKSAIIFTIISFSVFLSTKIDIVMVSIFRTPIDVGIYGVAYNIANSGTLIRNIFATALFPYFVKKFYNNLVKYRTFFKYALILGFFGLTISAIGSFFSRDIILLLLGSEYLDSSFILSILFFYLALLFIDIPFSNALQATHNEMQILKICWIAPLTNIGLNYLFLMKFGLIGIAYSTLIVTLIQTILLIYLTKRIFKN